MGFQKLLYVNLKIIKNKVKGGGQGQRLYRLIFNMFIWFEGLRPKYSTAYSWRDNHSINISTCRVWAVRARV